MVACPGLNFETPESRFLTPESPEIVGTRTIDLDGELALRGQGLGPGARPGDRVRAAADRAVEQARQLIRPRFIRVSSCVVRRSGASVQVRGTRLEGSAIAEALEGADHVVAAVCTLGVALDARVSSLLADDPLVALALDGLGSAACERLADDVWAEIEAEAAEKGQVVTGPLSPGMIGWPLGEAQCQLFALVDPAPLGVVLTSNGQMIPRKTLSFLVGVGAAVRARSSCPVCSARDRCRFRPSHA